jgi:hypothetical protein
MMACMDAADLMPDAADETLNRHFENRRVYTPLPALHVSQTTADMSA